MANMMDALFQAGQKEQLTVKAKEAPTLSMKDGVGILTFEALTLSTHEAGKAIPTRSRWQGKELRFEITESALAYVRQHWPNAIWLKSAQPRQVEPAQPLPTAIPWKPRLPPFKHQADACAASARAPEFAFLMDMGTGKSKALVDDMAFLVAEGLIDRVLIIAPNEVHRQWVDEVIPQHWPLELDIDTLAKPEKQRKKDRPFPGDCPLAPPGKLWLRTINFEALRMDKLPPLRVGGRPRRVPGKMVKELIRWLKQGRSMVAIDESHRIKSPSSLYTWAAWELAEWSLFRRILTGTPVGRDLMDYFAQFKFLNRKILGCDSSEGFRRQYCQMGGFQAQVITGYKNTEAFHQAIASCSWRVEKSDVLDLPPKLYGKRYVPLSPQQKAAYQELKRELLLELSDGTRITAAQAVQRILRLQQITQGFLPRDDGTFEEFPHHRLEVLDELVEAMPDKAVVWCRFTRDIDAICLAYGPRAFRYDGTVPKGKARKDAIRGFQAALPGALFVGTADAGGEGLDGLQGHASTVIYYSNSFKAIKRWQSEDRAHRIGTTGTVNYYDLVARGTMDAGILANLQRKKDVAAMSLAEIKALVMEEA